MVTMILHHHTHHEQHRSQRTPPHHGPAHRDRLIQRRTSHGARDSGLERQLEQQQVMELPRGMRIVNNAVSRRKTTALLPAFLVRGEVRRITRLPVMVMVPGLLAVVLVAALRPAAVATSLQDLGELGDVRAVVDTCLGTSSMQSFMLDLNVMEWNCNAASSAH